MASSTPAPQIPPTMQLMQIGLGYFLSRALHIVAERGVADHLAEGPQSAARLAELTQTNADALYRVMRSLSGVGVFQELPGEQFALTPVSELLRSDTPGSMRPLMVFMGDHVHWKAYGEMSYAVRTGQPGFEHAFGQPIFDYYQQHPTDARIFDDAMTSNSSNAIPPIVEAYDFEGIRSVADIAGGKGSLLAGMLGKANNARGVLFDLPHVIEAARGAGFVPPERTDFVAGDFFQAVPAGLDLYVMKHIIHDWDDAAALRILQSCRRAAAPHSKMLLAELVIGAPNEPGMSHLIDLEMLILAGGRERTIEQYSALFEKSGFQLARVIPTRSPLVLIEAVPV